jgi:hypothetical protein
MREKKRVTLHLCSCSANIEHFLCNRHCARCWESKYKSQSLWPHVAHRTTRDCVSRKDRGTPARQVITSLDVLSPNRSLVDLHEQCRVAWRTELGLNQWERSSPLGTSDPSVLPGMMCLVLGGGCQRDLRLHSAFCLSPRCAVLGECCLVNFHMGKFHQSDLKRPQPSKRRSRLSIHI